MNKTDRLLAIVLQLQRKKVVRAEDLATLFETSVRTIYRDIQALSEAGVPIIGAPWDWIFLNGRLFPSPYRFHGTRSREPFDWNRLYRTTI